MFLHLRRWHFDVAIFLGLTLFAWAYWNNVAQPTWQRPLCDPEQLKLTQAHLLKISSDQQYLSVFVEGNELVTGNTIRLIEHRRISDGSVMKQMPLEQPVELRQNQEKATAEYVVYDTFVAAQWATSEDMSFCRFYSPDDGKVIGPPVIMQDNIKARAFSPAINMLKKQFFVPMKQHAKDDYAWVLLITLNGELPPLPTNLLDLHTGIVLKTFTSPFAHARYGSLTPDGKHFILFWANNGAYEIEVFRTDTWASTGRSKSHSGYLTSIAFMEKEHFVTVDLVKPVSALRYPHHVISCYHLNTSSGSLSPDNSHPLHGTSSENRLIVEPPLLIENRVEQNARFTFPLLQTLEQWLARIGLQRNYSQRLSYFISDMTSGQPLRSIRNLPSAPHRANADWTQLFQLRTNQFGIYDTLVCYQIHTVIWNNTLSWLQWLSWLLVIPWPLRYFLRQPTVTRLPS